MVLPSSTPEASEYEKIHAHRRWLEFFPLSLVIHKMILENYDNKGSLANEFVLVIALLCSFSTAPIQIPIGVAQKCIGKTQ